MQFVNHFIHSCFTYYKTTNKSTEHRFNCCFSSQSNHGVFFNKISRVSEITVIRNVNNEQILDKIHFLLVNTKYYLFDHFQEQDRIFYFLSHKNRSILIILWFTSSKRHLNQGVDVVVIVRQVDLQLSVQSVPITSKVVTSNTVHGEVYSIQHYVIEFVSDLRQVSSTNKTDHHDITEILLKVSLNTIALTPQEQDRIFCFSH